ncbi:hypothetical protein, partial [Methylomonas albis]
EDWINFKTISRHPAACQTDGDTLCLTTIGSTNQSARFCCQSVFLGVTCGGM